MGYGNFNTHRNAITNRIATAQQIELPKMI